ncbi:hypothetical protein ACWIGI_36910 [Nocardia sp. NPDC055321]
MRLPSLLFRIGAVSAISLGIATGGAGASHAEPLPANPTSFQLGHVIGDNLTCRIHYRQWVETIPDRPGQLVAVVEPIRSEPAFFGSSEAESCGQWLDVNWSSSVLDGVQFEPRFGRQFVYLRADRTGGAPITLDIDATNIPAGHSPYITVSTTAWPVYALPAFNGQYPTIGVYNAPAR